MKKIKKIASVVLAMVMVLAMSLTAFAADPEVKEDKDYTAYLIFDKTSNGAAVSYSIDADSSWVSIVGNYEGITLKLSADGTKYVVNSTLSDSDGAAFAAYLAANIPSGAANTKVTANGDGNANTVTFTNMPEGFYLITSSLGSVVATTNGSGSIELIEKNTIPTIGKSSGTTTSVSIGDKVDYTLTYTDGKGTNKAVTITDTLPDSLTYNQNITVKKGDDALNTGDYTVEVTGQTIKITLTENYITSLDEGDIVTITYSATVNSNATSGTAITNNVKMEYNGEDQEEDNKVYTYDFNLQKVDENEAGLAGAEFTLYKNRTGNAETGYTYSNPVFVTSVADGYKVSAETTNNSISSTTGIVNVDGLAAGTYYLVETKAPAGYKLQVEDTEIVISDSAEAFTTATYEVVNIAGTSLPSTGGTGTTVLYTIGIILVLGAGILLVVRRRMSVSR